MRTSFAEAKKLDLVKEGYVLDVEKLKKINIQVTNNRKMPICIRKNFMLKKMMDH